MAWGACPLLDYGHAEDQGVFVWNVSSQREKLFNHMLFKIVQ